MSFSFTSFFYWKKCLPTWFVSACLMAILLHNTELFFVPLTGPTTHHPNLVLNAYGPPFLPCSTWIGSSAFVQFAPMGSPTDIFSSEFSWLTAGSKYFHCFSCPGLVMWSLSTESLSLVNVAGKGTYIFLSSLMPEICRPSIAFDGILNSPYRFDGDCFSARDTKMLSQLV